MKIKITDKDRVDWLIAGGYCPAEWRQPKFPLDNGHVSKNGLVFVGNGNRKTIDKLIKKIDKFIKKSLK